MTIVSASYYFFVLSVSEMKQKVGAGQYSINSLRQNNSVNSETSKSRHSESPLAKGMIFLGSL